MEGLLRPHVRPSRGLARIALLGKVGGGAHTGRRHDQQGALCLPTMRAPSTTYSENIKFGSSREIYSGSCGGGVRRARMRAV